MVGKTREPERTPDENRAIVDAIESIASVKREPAILRTVQTVCELAGVKW